MYFRKERRIDGEKNPCVSGEKGAMWNEKNKAYETGPKGEGGTGSRNESMVSFV